MEEDLVARLLAAVGLSALVGTRVYWGERPQGDALPAIVMHGISPGQDYSHSGPLSLRNPRIQFDCLGETFESTKLVERALTAALHQSPVIQGSTRFEGAFLALGRDAGTDTLAGGQKVHTLSNDFIIWNRPV